MCKNVCKNARKDLVGAALVEADAAAAEGKAQGKEDHEDCRPDRKNGHLNKKKSQKWLMLQRG